MISKILIACGIVSMMLATNSGADLAGKVMNKTEIVE